MKLRINILSIFCIFFALTLSAKQFTVVLDPGHGGKDPGAVGKKGQEKNINLNVALTVGKMINEKHPDVKVVYTRQTDKYVTLQERPNIANQADGDLFISIHTNASESTKAYGAETFTLGLSKSQANFEVAKRENSVLLLEEGNKETYQGFDPTSPDSYIMFEFMQSKYIDQSVEIAYYIQKEFVEIKRLDRGVRQAIFWVLHQVKMPSILVELGFITNPTEENFLISDEGQKKMATCIYSAFEKYKHEYDKRTITTPQIEQIKQETAQPEPAEAPKTTKKEKKKKENTASKTEVKTDTNPETKPNTAVTNIASNITYKIQIFSSRTIIPQNNSDYRKATKYQPVSHYSENGWYKYTCGDTYTYADAEKKLKEVQQTFKDALLVAFEGNKKISINEAKSKETQTIQTTQQTITKEEPQPKPQTVQTPETPKSNIVFRIQVFSSRNEVPKDNYDMRRIQKYAPIHHFTENGWYKYTCTKTSSYEEAKENLKKIQEMFKDAVIVAFDGDKKISIQSALEKLKN
ncbi:MAG: N-acetylmuramoyl-L-alanine amidase [Paludibacteraceae bacterium]|nr:N-acetylmuramoyl-L-alanine amidase [Paludibacteraceae bacterium]